ncbi:MAG TPA: EF-Tu/IF-2/RF-3 family GTPase [Gemmataceae bacterium]|nr:EF-Tu/IF-2/RF-3 family GTPase [Gemmataceae bacterium]
MKYAVLLVLLVVAFLVLRRWGRSLQAITDSFRLPVDEALALPEPNQTVVVGVVSEGEVRPGDRLMLRTGGATRTVTVESVEADHRPLPVARAGDRVSVKLVGAVKSQVPSGAVLESEE